MSVVMSMLGMVGKAWLALFSSWDVGMDMIIGVLWLNVMTMLAMGALCLERLGFNIHRVLVWVVG